MANAGANHLGIGLGYIYGTNLAEDEIVIVRQNNEQGLRDMRQHALVNAPIVANKIAIAEITVTGAAAAGNLTAITISGVNQISANVPCVSSVLATVAASWAAAINAFTPGSGIDFTASASGAKVYIFATPAAGATPNGVTPVISTSVGSLTATTTSFSGGSTNTGITDDLTGYRYWLDANYGASQIAGSTPAVRNPALPFLYAIEVTKELTNRGMQTGIPTLANTISSDTITPDRYSSITTIIADTQGGAATDYLVKIEPTGFVESDIVVIKGTDPTRVITVVSEPNAASVAPSVPNPNIFLTGDVSYTSDSGMIVLQFKDGIFTEMVRGAAPASTGIISVTYAAAAALIAGSALLPGRRYKITDRGDAGLILDADDVNRFKMSGVYIASYSSVLYDEFCVYDFGANSFRERHDIRGNVVIDPTGAYSAINVFPWGNDNIIGNTLIGCVPSISSTVTAFRYNKFVNVNCAIATLTTVTHNDVKACQTTVNASGTMVANVISGGNAVVVSGNLSYSFVDGNSALMTVAAGGTVINAQILGGCSFTCPSGYVMVGEFSYLDDSNISNYSVASVIGFFKKYSGSSFIHTGAIAGLSGYTNTDVKSAGTVQISGIVLPMDRLTLGTITTPMIVKPDGTETLVIRDNSVNGGNFYLADPATTLTLVGTNGDYAVFDLVGSNWKYNRHVIY